MKGTTAMRGRRLASIAGMLLVAAPGAHAGGVGPWRRTEAREPCARFAVLRTPYFGDTHVHTTYSFDAVTGDVRTGPRDAYRFAAGESIDLPPYTPDGHALRSARLGRPLDFTAVTDHSEFFGETLLCLIPDPDPAAPYNSSECQTYRAGIPQLTQVTTPGVQLFALRYMVPEAPSRFDFCGPGATTCLGEASLVWQDEQAAAEEHYDRTAACTFTTFVAYEWTGNTNLNNLHRNVIFRNDTVPALPISHVEQPTAQGLWAALRDQCLAAGLVTARSQGCDVLAIPHNSNLSGGAMFLAENADGSPLTATDAAFRAAMEPLVEITQHKGDSECRTGVLTSDEYCGFEKWSGIRIGLPPDANQTFPPLLFVRNALKEGLAVEQRLGVNPFRLGLVGSTDTHNSTPGNTREDTYQGHLGTRDATPELLMTPLSAGIGIIGGIEANPGGLAVVWAEENSRDALFAALRRRETYATSGTRPILRFFGGALAGARCGARDLIERAYADGTPMGGELGPVSGRRSPRFAVVALQDPGEPGVPGTPLQQVQIVKGWVDASGETHEKVFEVAGNARNGARVDPHTCATSGPGADTLCAVWRDPGFDRRQRAFYYARVLENPVCRWSMRLCNAQGVDCAAGAPPGLEECCDPRIPASIQERAWSSPIWYRPEGIARLAARIAFGAKPGRDVLRIVVRLGQVPAGFDPTHEDVTLTVDDDDRIFGVTIPAGTLRPSGPAGRLVLSAPPGALDGVRHVVWSPHGHAGATLTLKTVPTDLSHADRVDHMVEVALRAGAYQASASRLWRATPNALATASVRRRVRRRVGHRLRPALEPEVARSQRRVDHRAR